jgi:hypothetical protein
MATTSALFVLMLLLIAAPESPGQSARIKFQMIVKDHGTGASLGIDTLTMGVHPDATRCIDTGTLSGFSDGGSVFEQELPPAPPAGVFDARLIDPVASNECMGQGLKVNIQPFVDTTEVDTFIVLFQPGAGGTPITLRWPNTLSTYWDRLEMKDPFGFGIINVDMLAVDSFVVTNTAFTKVNIYAYGPKAQLTPPLPPVLNTPSNGATDVSVTPTFTWQASADAEYYRLQVGTSAAFTTLIYNDTVRGTSKQIPALEQSTQYFWRVSGTNAVGTGAYQSSPFSFTTLTLLPPAPALASPSNGATGVTTPTTFRWRTVGVAESYRIQVSTQQNFSSVVFDSAGITDTSLQVGGLQNCFTYYWHVRSKNNVGDGNYSAPSAFTVTYSIPAVPVLTGPADNATGQPEQPTLTWTGDVCSDSFRVQVSLDPAFGSGNLVVNRTSKTGSMQIGPLPGDTIYHWQVLAFNPAGASVYSSSRSFRTALFPPSLPFLSSPANGETVSATSPTFSWSASTNRPAFYVLQIDTINTFANPLINDSSITTASAVEGPLNNCESYFWRVRSVNAAGRSAFTVARSFNVARAIPGPPQLLIPADNQTGVDENTTLTWKGDICTNDFVLQVSTDSLFGSFIVNETIAATSRQIGPLGSAITYFWRVAARNELGTGTPAVRRFTTTSLTTPPAPALVSPANNALNVALAQTFTWNASPRATSYRLQLAIDAGFDTLLINDSTITGTSYASPQLPNGMTMYWRVNSKNLAGTSVFSPVFVFSTLAPPAGPFLIQPPNGAGGVSVAPRLLWSLPDGADSFEVQVSKRLDFSLIVFEKSGLTLTSWDVFGLDGNTQYFWRVRGFNSSGTGEWSTPSSFVTTLTGAANWVVPLAVSETGVARDTIYFGIRPGASVGIDPAFGEYELPPPPSQGFFDVRFIDPPGHERATGEGLRVSYYPFKSYAQVDTFKFSFQTGTGSYPVSVSWPMQFVRIICDSMVLVDDFGGFALHTRMDQVSSMEIQNSSITTASILLYGPKPLPTGVNPPVTEIPSGFVLSQNYPNPFNPTTHIDFSAERGAHITVEVFDLLGRKVETLADGAYGPGRFSVEWTGRNSNGQPLESGVYFVRMTASVMGMSGGTGESFIATRRMLLMK